MTTFNDPPPQSRRAARQSEREHTSDEQPATEGFTTFPANAENEQSSAADDRNSSAFVVPNAEAAETGSESRSAEPTVTRPSANAGSEQPMTRRELREMRAREEAASRGVEVSEERAEEAPAAASALPKPAKTVDELSFAPDAQLYVEPPALVDPLAVVPEAASGSAPLDALSAFESLLAAPDSNAATPPASAAPRSPLADLPAPAASARSFAADLPAPTSSPASTSSPAPAQFERPTIEGLLGLEPEPSEPESPAADSTSVASSDQGADEQDSVDASDSAASSQTTLSDARAEFDELSRKRLDGDITAASAVTANPEASNFSSGLSAGHWSTQANAADEPNDAIVTRTIGSGSTATNALVLPAIPFATDIRGPLNSSGEPMLTGSIDLPSTLSASGVSDRFDRGDIDSLLDLNDSDMVSTDSAPVRAVRAVSTFSNQSVTQTQKPKGTRALTVLLISAASMAVVVAGLLVAAFAFNML
ncbi:hypothetical protein [uncultured Salinibacterium sp.]|mgnify:FL=1|uniref:hypothetical protein n=1 Tax=uncultured Salinibacterium sp. TaxID=459274 RepID=UPI0030DD7BA0|tara:strand:- start:361508 stop:362944 length:1437 start_codon:yes stop_codon:yes gene_type:complete